jgi:hypothetical protein
MIVREIKDRAETLVPGRTSWRSDLKIAFAPAEKVFDLASEKLKIERWLVELEAAYSDGQSGLANQLLRAMSVVGQQSLTRSSQFYAGLMDEVTRRVKSVSATLRGEAPSLTIELRPPRGDLANDNDREGAKTSA